MDFGSPVAVEQGPVRRLLLIAAGLASIRVPSNETMTLSPSLGGHPGCIQPATYHFHSLAEITTAVVAARLGLRAWRSAAFPLNTKLPALFGRITPRSTPEVTSIRPHVNLPLYHVTLRVRRSSASSSSAMAAVVNRRMGGGKWRYCSARIRCVIGRPPETCRRIESLGKGQRPRHGQAEPSAYRHRRQPFQATASRLISAARHPPGAH